MKKHKTFSIMVTTLLLAVLGLSSIAASASSSAKPSGLTSVGNTTQMLSNSAPAAVVGGPLMAPTATTAGPQIFFYNKDTGVGTTGNLKNDGSYNNQVTYNTFRRNWSIVAPVSDEHYMLLFYDRLTGLTITSRVNPDGTLTQLQSIGIIVPGWDLIASPTETGLVLFYDSDLGVGLTARVLDNGVIVPLRTYANFTRHWTQIVSTRSGILFFYDTASGNMATGEINDDGTFVTLSSSVINRGLSLVAPGNIDTVILYSPSTGQAVTGRVATDGTYSNAQFLTIPDPAGGWTHLASTIWGELLFYNTANGAAYAGCMCNSDGNIIDPRDYPAGSFPAHWSQILGVR